MNGGCQVIIRKASPWSRVDNIFGEGHAPCKLNTSYVDLKKSWRIVSAKKDYFCCRYPTLRTFSVASNVVGPVRPSIPYFYMFFYVLS